LMVGYGCTGVSGKFPLALRCDDATAQESQSSCLTGPVPALSLLPNEAVNRLKTKLSTKFGMGWTQALCLAKNPAERRRAVSLHSP